MSLRHTQVAKGSASPAGDDFSLIRGVGLGIRTRLHDAGIRTFARLAACSPESIAAIVTVRSAKGIVKENWIGQARKLASKAASAEPKASETIGDTRQHYATFTVELLLDEDNDVRRTRAAYVQGKLEEAWAGWAEPRLVDFFVRCAKLHVLLPELAPLPEAVSPPVPIPSAPTTVRPPCVKLQNGLSGALRVGEIITVPFGSDLPQYKLHANEAFNVRLVLDLTEVKKSPAISLEYTVTIWAKKLGTGARQIAGEARGTFMPADQVPCTVEAVINSQGTYRLEVLVSLTEQGKESLSRHKLIAMQTSSLRQVS